MTKYKKGKISPFSLFAMFLVCRVLVVFTVCNVTSLGSYSSDLLISVGIGLVMAILLSLPIIFLIKKKKNLLEQKWLSVIYGIYFMFLGAVSIGRFSFFASMELNEQTQAYFIAAIIIVSCMYAAWLGIEPVSRFGSFIFILTIIGIISIAVFGIQNFSFLNLFPFTRNSVSDIFINSLSFACETSEIILLLALAPNVNGGVEKPFYYSVILSFIVCGILFIFSIGVLGDTASLSSFPFYELSQMSKFDESERLDSVYTAFWIFAVFLKGTLFIYSSAQCLKPKGKGKGCVISGIGTFLIILIIAKFRFFLRVQNWFIIIPFLVFAFVIPVLYLIFRKKSKGEILLENF